MQLHHLFVQTAKRMGKKIAVYDKGTGGEYTYSKMLIASLILKKKFAVYKSQYLGIMLPTSAGCMLSIIATLMVGKIPVMINYATGAIENSLYAREKCNFKTIITSKKLLEKLNIEPLEHMVFIEDILAGVSGIEKIEAALLSKMPYFIIRQYIKEGLENDTCVILFTTGSEKEPKAVQLSHRNIHHNVVNVDKAVNFVVDDVFLSILPLFHVFGLTVDFWMPIIIGCTIVTYPNPLEFREVSNIARDYKTTFIAATPSFLYGYLHKSDPGDFSTVRFAFAGADKLPEKIYEGFLKKHGMKIYEGYGTTETSPVVSVNSPNAHKVGSIGRPIPNTYVKITDIETGKDLAPNKEGKLLVRGELVMEGYLDNPEETSMRIRDHWYDTGDIGMLDEDGFLWHRGRLKRFVKVGGEMVSLVKVEELLTQILPEDVVCCVVDVPSAIHGSDVVAAVANGKIDVNQVRKELQKLLPAIAVPKTFYMLDSIPMMGSGKVNFREVEKICREKASEE